MSGLQSVVRLVGEGLVIGTVSIRQLADETSRIVNQVVDSGDAKVITKHGRPVAVLSTVTDDQAREALAAVLAVDR